MPVTVAIVEDNASIRETLEKLIADAPGFTCVCTCETGGAALRMIPRFAPQVVVMDIRLPDLTGIECTARLKRQMPALQVLMFTVHEDHDNIFKALEAGACGYILKRSTPEEILDAITDIQHGGAPMSSEIARKVVQSFRRKEPAISEDGQLTRREEEILSLLSQGYANKEIADKLSINYDTVRTHLKHIYEKLHVRSRTEAVIKFLH